MIKISVFENQPELEATAISAVFLKTGMSQDESDYYADQIVVGAGFEIEAPESTMVREMIGALEFLGVRLESVVESAQ